MGESLIGGLELGAAYRITPELTLFGNASWLDGQEETREGAGDPVVETVVSRLAPLMAQFGGSLQPQGSPWSFEARWLHAVAADRLSPRDIADDSRIPPGGTPGYNVFDVTARYRFSSDFEMTLAVENLADEDYRIHGSGQNQPGRNVVVSARWSF